MCCATPCATCVACRAAQIMLAVSIRGMRPEWPTDVPRLQELADLSRSCWAQDAEDRPTFSWLVGRLSDMLEREESAERQGHTA